METVGTHASLKSHSPQFDYGVNENARIHELDTSCTGQNGQSFSDVLTPSTPIDKPVPGQHIDIDSNIKSALPVGYKFSEAKAYGSSLWTQTAKITAISDSGEVLAFFLKTAAGELGEKMFQGEFEGMTAINQAMPDFSPKPIAWGRCKNTPDLFFFLSSFIEMDEGDIPDPKEFCENLAKMHRQSTSPTGKFGFHVTTCNGNIPQNNTWNESWQDFFSNGLRHMLALDLQANGKQPELLEAIEPIFDRVIPRLLGPLEQGPNRIRPALVHGDLWFGNCSTNLNTDEPVIFDAAAFYAHSEYELGNWRPVRNRLKTVHLGVYKSFNPPSHPAAEFEDRIMLYELRFNFHFCIMVSGLKDIKKEYDTEPWRNRAIRANLSTCRMIANMKYLAEKYPTAAYSD
ncbi:hypothetical protein PWT90_07186 [Aphanocladium album]|nr:hypothetical protein PWT90_07186 [Aphanocladium album]